MLKKFVLVLLFCYRITSILIQRIFLIRHRIFRFWISIRLFTLFLTSLSTSFIEFYLDHFTLTCSFSRLLFSEWQNLFLRKLCVRLVFVDESIKQFLQETSLQSTIHRYIYSFYQTLYQLRNRVYDNRLKTELNTLYFLKY